MWNNKSNYFLGQIDDETLETMKLPRCGVKDKVGFGNGDRSKRYALQGKFCKKTKHVYTNTCTRTDNKKIS